MIKSLLVGSGLLLIWAPVINLMHASQYLIGQNNNYEGAYCDIVVRDPDVHQNNHWYNGGSSIENIITFYRLHTTIKCVVSNLEFKCLVDITFFLGL